MLREGEVDSKSLDVGSALISFITVVGDVMEEFKVLTVEMVLRVNRSQRHFRLRTRGGD